MNTDLLKKILESGITVQGDLVIEKHVAHEIGNVENGGIGIQIINQGQDQSPRPATKPTPHGEAEPLLSTPEAEALWQQALEAGWVDQQHQPTTRLSTKAAKAMLAHVMITRLNIPSPSYAPFEKLWGVTGLQNCYSSGINYATNDSLRKEMLNRLR